MEKDLEKNIGNKIKRLRQFLNMSQDELAQKIGYSKSFISKIENGNISVAIATLSKIAKVLGVELSWFFEEEEEGQPIYIMKRVDINQSPKDDDYFFGYSYYPLANNKRLPFIQTFLVHVPQQVKDKKPFTHDEEEFAYVIRGTIDLYYDGTLYRLEEGDNAYFDGTIPHMFLPVDGDAHVLVVMVRKNQKQENH